ncbi:hypothetical protein GUA87_05775 [Sneathiella sp. P13V-1]|uniref:class I SAM-dependent methyltransferase n=1 Tax=Sneathiella sp. P13V-1 TaxID=2697366 RepID=UPI00187B2137|nr:class I SAM-dependent methyltransferase [Sneathiella sp. P13V-1]MBE7636345.1 hypothetical protein [Sneathiella sp. P13V-1]
MKHYEELTGGEGKRVFYRAERFKASTLMQEISPVISLDDDNFEIFDMSMSGLSYFRPASDVVSVSPEKDIPLTLKLGPEEVFSGSGKVRRIEAHESVEKVAIELTKGYLDIQRLMEQHDDLAMRRQLREGMKDISPLVPSEYKTVISDAVYLLRSVRTTLEQVEHDMPAKAPRREERIQEIILECERDALKRWREISKKSMEIMTTIRNKPEVMKAAKQYTERTLTPELTPGASWKRSYEKPLGYPGDFEVMNYAYNLAMLGETPYEKFCHRLGTSTGEFITTRMTLVKQKIAELVNNAAHNGVEQFNIASLGCGPAQEVSNFLRGHAQPVNVNFTLIDQDDDALSYAYNNAYPQVVQLDGKATVNCLHATFLEFLAAGNLFKKLDNQDMIYAVGLVDYLTDKRAARLVKDLYKNLNPGGTLMIGSMYDSDSSLEWQVEMITDWQLEYRDEENMLNMANSLPEDAVRKTIVDKTGHCIILMVTKPS